MIPPTSTYSGGIKTDLRASYVGTYLSIWFFVSDQLNAHLRSLNHIQIGPSHRHRPISALTVNSPFL